MLRQQDEPAKRRYFGDLLAGNQRQGPHSWAIAELDPWAVTPRWPPSAGSAAAPNGSTIWEFLDSYLLAPDQGQRRILGDVVHA